MIVILNYYYYHHHLKWFAMRSWTVVLRDPMEKLISFVLAV